jgi:hypothetical protein
MTGGVYFLDDPEAAPFGNHPCVIVLEIAGSAECIVVPAFSVGRQTVEDGIDELIRAGLPREAIVVTLDNRQHITVTGRFELHDAHWMVAQHRRLPAQLLRQGKRIGTMDGDGTRLLAKAICALAVRRPNDFSAPILKKLRRLAGHPGASQAQP